MQTLSRRLLEHAHGLAQQIGARAVVVYADAVEGDEELRQVLGTVNFPTILFTRAREVPVTGAVDSPTWISRESMSW